MPRLYLNQLRTYNQPSSDYNRPISWNCMRQSTDRPPGSTTRHSFCM